MEVEDGYNYSVTVHHLQPFVNPLNDEPFIAEMEDSYGSLWEFKKHISNWSFGVNRWKNYVFLRYKIVDKPGYLTWNIKEKVVFIDAHQHHYVLVVLREVDETGKAGKHCHSIVMNVNSQNAQFDLENLMTFLEGSYMESLNQDFVDNGYVPWKNGTAKTNAMKLSLIFQALDRYALSHVETQPAVGGNVSNNLQRASGSSLNPPSGNTGGKNKGTQQSQPMPKGWKRAKTSSGGAESSRKRRKSAPGGTLATGSFGSALTTVGTAPSEEPMEAFQRHALIQRNFWAEHKPCFLFDQNTVTVDIKQCIPPRDQYVIRALQETTLKGMREFLITLIDIKQRQKVCVTPVDIYGNLLRTKPAKWEDIETGKFMTINGQHSITASQELQIKGCGEARKVELQKWDAYVVWTLDPNKLRAISRYYNATNHLDHAQPTWGNQIISCRNIWIACKRPTDVLSEHVNRRNQANHNLTNYKSFADAVIDRYQNINPVGDGASIRGPSDLKNEIQIITLPDDLWEHWKSFLTKHAEGDLIDPVTKCPYRENKGFRLKSNSLKKEFFKHGGHFTDHDFGTLAQHLLGTTPGRHVPYPKVSVSKTKILVVDNMANFDWVERRKRKKVVLQDLMDIKPALAFVDNRENVIDETWRSWKTRHRFTSGTWDFLISHPKPEYFKRRLRNDAWLRRAKDLMKEFPEVLHMFTCFMKMKYSLPELRGGVQLRGIDIVAKALVTSSRYKYHSRVVNLAVVDMRKVPRSLPTGSEAAIDPFFNFLADKLEPKMTEPNVWLFILNGKEDLSAATNFAALKLAEYDCVRSTYVPCKAEMLNNITNRGVALDVPLLFLFKKENEFAATVRNHMKVEYSAPWETCPYYKDTAKNTEAKWRVNATELRMEFYLDILQAFATPEENVLGIYTGAKFMLSSKMFGAYFYGFLDKDDAKPYMKIAYLADKMDKNDFMHSNSPYLLGYVPPPRRGPVIVDSNSPPSPPMTLALLENSMSFSTKI